MWESLLTLFTYVRLTLLRLETGVRSLQADLRIIHNSQQENRTAQVQRAHREEALIVEPVNRLLASQQRMELKLCTIQATNMVSAGPSEVTIATKSMVNLGRSCDHDITRNKVQISTSTHWQCSDTCRCDCHERRKIRTPPILSKVLRILFLGYVGLPYLTPRCNISDCCRSLSPTASVTYFFPSWLVARTFRLVMEFSALQGPELHLRVTRIVPNKSRVFTLAASGDIEGMKELFRQGLASPFDADDLNRHTPLMVSRVEPVSTCYQTNEFW